MNLDDLRGKHAGKCAVILGAGMSLRFVDERIRKDRVLIAINDAVIKFPKPDYYMSMDPTMVTRRHWSVVTAGDFPCVLKRDTWDGHGGFEGIVGDGKALPESRAVLVPWKKDRLPGPRSYTVSRDDNEFIIGGSSAHSAVNLAVVLGCETIYLVGCDCRIDESGRRYFWQFDGQHQYVGGMADQDPATLLEHREPEDVVLKTYVGAGWEQLKDSNPGITIVDASDGVLRGILLYQSIDELQA